MKHYVFIYWSRRHYGKHYFLAADEEAARKMLRKWLHKKHPFQKFTVKLEQVLP